jgi:hypothetical protein
MASPRQDSLQIDASSSPLSPVSPVSATDNSPGSESNLFLSESLIEFTDEDNVLIDIQIPLKNKPLARFIPGNVLPHTSFHQVSRVEEIDEDELRDYYFKLILKVEGGSRCPYLAEVEAALGEFYHFIAPRHTPKTYAVYDKDSNYVGVVSEKIPFFNPASEEALLLDDLDDNFMQEKNLSFEQLDAIDDEIYAIEQTIETAHRKLQRILKYEALAINEVYISRVPNMTVPALQETFTQQHVLKTNLLEAMHKSKQQLQLFYERLINEQNIKPTEFKKYRRMKGQGISLSVSYTFHENDLNRNNTSPDGKRIDFDMSEWDFLYNISSKGFLVSTLRKPGDNDAVIDTEDILHFPNLVTFKPFYWPTQTLSVSESALAILKKYFTISTNPWGSAEVEVYKKLEFNSIFVHHKFATLLKYILSHHTMYLKLARLHIRRERNYGNSWVVEHLVEIQRLRIQNMERVLTGMPQFWRFFLEYGKKIKDQFVLELAERNADLEKKINKLKVDDAAARADYLYEDPGNLDIARQISTNATLIRLFEYQKINPQSISKSHKDIDSIIQINRRKASLDPEQKPTHSARFIQAEELGFQKTKSHVITAMKVYINPGFLYGKGMFRKHIADAQALIDFCEALAPDADYACSRLSRLQSYIENLMTKLTEGGFKDALSELLMLTEFWITPVLKESPQVPPIRCEKELPESLSLKLV